MEDKKESNNNNLELWKKVEKTNPNYTKKAKVGGNQITSISPQFQIMNVTEQFGSYGETWGFKDIELDFSLASIPFKKDKTEGSYPNVKIVGKEDAYMGLVVFKATFFYPNGSFPTINSISLFTNNQMSKLDDNFAKKLETDTLTKAISKLGFNADIFMGKFDDVRYLNEVKKEFETEEQEKNRLNLEAKQKELAALAEKNRLAALKPKVKPKMSDEVYQKASKSDILESLKKSLVNFDLTPDQIIGISKRIQELNDKPKS